MDIHELFERGGLSPIRVAVADVARSAAVCQADCVVDASILPVPVGNLVRLATEAGKGFDGQGERLGLTRDFLLDYDPQGR